MNQIIIDVNDLYHPPKVVLRENGNIILEMPADELISRVKLWIQQENERRSMEEIITKAKRRVGLGP